MVTVVDPYCQPAQRGGLGALAHFHNRPMFSLGRCNDAKLVDERATAEAAPTLLADGLSGGHLIHDLGYLEPGLTGSLAQLAICDEIVQWIRQASAEIEVSDETLALDVIDAVGPDGEFLTSDHTLRHCRDQWHPRLLDRHTYDDWRASGGASLRERAAARVDEILASHAPEPLPADTARALRVVVERLVQHAGQRRTGNGRGA